jgi:hypothetical protein
MTLNEAATYIANQLGLSLATGNMTTNVYAWLNRAYRNIAGFHTWSWLRDNVEVPVYADQVGTGATLANGATTVTFSVTGPVAPFLYDNNINDWYIQFDGDDDWYRLAYNVLNTTLRVEINSAYQKTSLADVAWTVRKYFYALPSTVAYAYSATQAHTKMSIQIIDSTKYDTYVPFNNSTGTPSSIVFWGYDADNNWQFTPYSFPDSTMNLSFRTIKKITTDLTASETPIFPERFSDLWLEGAKAYAYEFLDDDRQDKSEKKFKDRLGLEKGSDTVGLSQNRVLSSIEQQPTTGNLIRFPAEFGNVKG